MHRIGLKQCARMCRFRPLGAIMRSLPRAPFLQESQTREGALHAWETHADPVAEELLMNDLPTPSASLPFGNNC